MIQKIQNNNVSNNVAFTSMVQRPPIPKLRKILSEKEIDFLDQALNKLACNGVKDEVTIEIRGFDLVLFVVQNAEGIITKGTNKITNYLAERPITSQNRVIQAYNSAKKHAKLVRKTEPSLLSRFVRFLQRLSGLQEQRLV
ncbi:MAG: hypothetical protein PHC64_05685 [Candidatus Gastranaerophilales bacterium]|nr:hypothetical protein [Candidatus Gastranaerophilales bacterium]